MQRNILQLFIFILLGGLVFTSCSRQTMMHASQTNALETAQLQNPALAEVAETDDALAEIELEAEPATEIAKIKTPEADFSKKTVAKKKNYKAKIAALSHKTVSKIAEKKPNIGLQTATMHKTADPDNGLVATGVIFLVMGLVMLLPAFLISAASFLFIIAGILIVIGGLILLTGVARKAE